MAKPKRPRGPKPQKARDDDDSDAEASVPSSKDASSQYFHDEVDKFHEDKTTRLLAAGVQLQSDDEGDVDSDDEVMALDSSGDDDALGDDQDSMASDLEEHRGGEMPNELAWGQKKKLYYDTDYVAQDRKKSTNREEEDAEAEEEEVEAQRIQKRLAGNLDEEDYGLDFLQAFAPKQKPAGQKIEKDLKKMSEKEKLKMLKKESPELLELLQDLRVKLTELDKDLKPLVQMVKEGIIPPGKGSSYIQTKYQLYLNYCTNISYYLVLKAKRIPVHGHPVIERLVSYRNLINDLGVVDERLSSEIRLLLKEAGKEKRLEASKSISTANRPAAEPRKKNPCAKKAALEGTAADEMDNSDLDDEAALKYYKQMENALKFKRKRASSEPADEEETDMADFDPKAKRAITRQIAKNRGLTPKRKKIDRNPRVKHREKFRRAKIRRKGQVREVRKEESRYSGELSGIRAGIKKSIKLK